LEAHEGLTKPVGCAKFRYHLAIILLDGTNLSLREFCEDDAEYV
jgi:hypothetical protein